MGDLYVVLSALMQSGNATGAVHCTDSAKPGVRALAVMYLPPNSV